jgi:hypothetical protein
MFGKQTKLAHIAQGIAVVAVLAVVAVPTAFASTSSAAQSCVADPTWINITDDLGLSQLVPVPQTVCAAELTCTTAAQTGWVSQIDDLGVPFLVPTGPTTSAGTGPCVVAQAATVPASKITKAKVAKAKITKSKYRGWVLITDTTGNSKLVSRSDIRGS